MEYIIIALFLLAMFHFIYEGIIAPTARVQLRLNFERKQREFEKLKHLEGKKIPRESLEALRSFINFFSKNFYGVSINTIITTKMQMRRASQSNLAEFKHEVSKLEKVDVPEYVQLRKETNRLCSRALIINSGGWMVYVVPVFIAYLCSKGMKRFALWLCCWPTPEVQNAPKSTFAKV